MLKVSNAETMNWDNAIRGMRNPMNSWDKMDSEWDGYGEIDGYSVGSNDLSLMTRLRNAGSDHRKFMRQILVSVDITAPLYWWKEFDTYKVGTTANSCSTMHKIHAKEFTLDDFSHEHLNDRSINCLQNLISVMNLSREHFVTDKSKDDWWQMIQLLPTSYNQMRTVTMNYEVLMNMYHARRHHKLDEWHTLCDWIESLPYAKELIVGEREAVEHGH